MKNRKFKDATTFFGPQSILKYIKNSIETQYGTFFFQKYFSILPNYAYTCLLIRSLFPFQDE